MGKDDNKETISKFDTDKPNLSILLDMPHALSEIAKVVDYGANKYGRSNWRKAKQGKDFERYLSATLRHLVAYKSGELIDPESGLEHLAHASTSLLFLLELEKNIRIKMLIEEANKMLDS